MQLELKHLVPYLPYKLLFKTNDGWCTLLTINYDTHQVNECYEEVYELKEIKPYLRPLSDLNKNELKDVAKELWDKCVLSKCIISDRYLTEKMDIEDISYFTMVRLIENHFDIFGLIEKNLAIDINTI